MFTSRIVTPIVVFVAILLPQGQKLLAVDPPEKSLAEKTKEIAGAAEYLRSVPKKFAILKAKDARERRATLLIEGENAAKEWPLIPDAEVKVAGWWGRLEQLTIGDRVWVWFQTNRSKEATAISMIADELSEQDIHGSGLKVQRIREQMLTLKPSVGEVRTVSLNGAKLRRGNSDAALDSIRDGERLFAQTAASGVRLLLDPEALEAARNAQKAGLRRRWLDEGLPATITFLHRFSGEMEAMLDHEAMRWARTFKRGDKVTISSGKGALVKIVQPWRERTHIRLVVSAVDQSDLHIGQRIFVRCSPPAKEVEESLLPPDIDQPRSKQERIDWFLASIYCPCKVKGNNCTGDFYTLASCNPNGCGMPNHFRKLLAERIDRGQTDRQIFEELLKEYGPDLVKQHLMP